MKKILFPLFLCSVIFLFPFVFSASCGDGVCEGSENKCNCQDDCGVCEGTGTGVCQEFVCLSGVCQETYLLNCCGNKVCETGETYLKCEIDCSPQRIDIELIDFDKETEFSRGDEVKIKAKILADERIGTKASVTAKGFFGQVTMYDDGNHNDEKLNDGIYGNSFFIDENIKEGVYEITIEAEKERTIGLKLFSIKINPVLEIEATLNKQIFSLGDEIIVEGFVKKKGEPFFALVNLDFISHGKSFFQTNAESDKNGFFVFERHTSLIDPAGDWLIELSAKDANNNRGVFQKEILVEAVKGTAFYQIEFIDPIKKSFNRGNEISVLVRVEDESGEGVENALVEATISSDKLSLLEVSPGNYRGEVVVPFDSALGEQELVVVASKQEGEILFSGHNSTILFINMSKINVEVIAPKESIFLLGSLIDFKFQITYEDDSPVLGAKANLHVNKEIIRLKEEGNGVYSGNFLVPVEKEEKYDFFLMIEDKYFNTEKHELPLVVKPELPPLHFITGNPIILALVIVVLLFLGVVAIFFGKNIVKMKYFLYKKERLIEAKTKLQNRYFNETNIGSSDYYSLIEKYNQELGEIETEIKMLKEG